MQRRVGIKTARLFFIKKKLDKKTKKGYYYTNIKQDN